MLVEVTKFSLSDCHRLIVFTQEYLSVIFLFRVIAMKVLQRLTLH